LTEVLNAEKANEFERLYQEYAKTVRIAASVLRVKGMESEEFRKADAAAGDLWVKLRNLQGMTGKHSDGLTR
jgi:hypothetical protein